MRTCLLTCLIVLVTAPWTMAQDDASMKAFNKLNDAFKAKVTAFREEARGIKDRDAYFALYEKKYPKAGPIVPEMLAIVKKYPGSDGAMNALQWILNNDRENGEALSLPYLGDQFIDRPEVKRVVSRLAYSSSNAAREFLLKAAKSENHEIRGHALFGLGKWHATAATAMGRMKTYSEQQATSFRKRMGETAVSYIQSAGNTQLEQIALMYFHEVANDYGDVIQYRKRTLADAARGAIFEMTNLAIGKEAPDIVAEDIDGVEFALSDYRGKVVVLDFWGNW